MQEVLFSKYLSSSGISLLKYLSSVSHIFVTANQLSGFSISRLANVEDFFHVNILFKCKYKLSLNDNSFKGELQQI